MLHKLLSFVTIQNDTSNSLWFVYNSHTLIYFCCPWSEGLNQFWLDTQKRNRTGNTFAIVLKYLSWSGISEYQLILFRTICIILSDLTEALS